MRNKLNIKNGLIYTSIELTHEGNYVTIDDVIIDTGAFHTIIATDFLDEMGAKFSNEDKLKITTKRTINIIKSNVYCPS